MVGYGLALLHFSFKEFDILDLDPPINATSHYGACHFRYNFALNQFFVYLKDFFYDDPFLASGHR